MTLTDDIIILIATLLGTVVLPIVVAWAWFKYDGFEWLHQFRKRLYMKRLRRKGEMLKLKKLDVDLKEEAKVLRDREREFAGERGIIRLVKGFGNIAKNLSEIKDGGKKEKVTRMGSLTNTNGDKEEPQSDEELMMRTRELLEEPL